MACAKTVTAKVAIALWRGFATGLYQQHLLRTLTETLLGFLLGSALGLLLGTVVALNRYVEYFFYPYIVMFQSVPKVALAPLIVVWFGLILVEIGHSLPMTEVEVDVGVDLRCDHYAVLK